MIFGKKKEIPKNKKESFAENFLNIKKIILFEKKIVKEMISHLKSLDEVINLEEKKEVFSNIILLKDYLKKENEKITTELEKIILIKPLPILKKNIKLITKKDKLFAKTKKIIKKSLKLTRFEKKTLRRLKHKKEEKKFKKKKPSKYVQFASKLFSNIPKSIIHTKFIKNLEENLIKSNLNFVSINYVSTILLTTIIAFFIAIFFCVFFLFFNVGPRLPIITFSEEDIGMRFVKIFWILILLPIITALGMYVYPFLEKKSIGNKIDQELPFATIHMSSVSGSMIDPSKIFSIILAIKEYPYLEKEFIKLINEINVYGYDLVTALRNTASNTPSPKLAELLKGLATTINSGGDLPNFFNKRAETLLLDYKLEREKRSKMAETFMDIYISVVIAAPMILMFLLMIINVSGLGFSISASVLSLIMVLGVTMINIMFLTFLHLKQAND